MGILGGKIGKGVVRYWPPTNSFLLFGILASVPILVKIDQEMRRESARRRTDRHTHGHTDANRFYNLSHAICYSYGTDNYDFVENDDIISGTSSNMLISSLQLTHTSARTVEFQIHQLWSSDTSLWWKSSRVCHSAAVKVQKRCSPVLVELGGHLFTQSVNHTRHRFFAVVRRGTLQFLIEHLDDALMVRESLFKVVHSLLVNVGVERDLAQQLSLAVLGVDAQTMLAVGPAPHTATQRSENYYS